MQVKYLSKNTDVNINDGVFLIWAVKLTSLVSSLTI